MDTAVQDNPLFELLRDIETRSRQKALGIPQQLEVRKTWSGIGFRLGASRLLAPFGEVSELLTVPRLTRIPGARPWVLGLANIRGSLLPILDMSHFIEGEECEIGGRTRLLVVNMKGVAAGLMVDEVYGLRHFFDEEKTEFFPQTSERMMSYLSGAYQRDGDYWGVFSLAQLSQDAHFKEVASPT